LYFPAYRYAFNPLNEANGKDIWARFDERKEFIIQDYQRRQTALGYYQKVLKYTSDSELGAKAAVLAHSSQNPHNISQQGYSEYFQTAHDTTFFHVLHDQFQDTEVYEDLIEECATFKLFVNKQKEN
jgi:hypothetical protein